MSMKVLLIEPPFYMFQAIQPCAASFGLAMPASTIQKDGHEVRVFSPDFEFRQSTMPEKVVTSFEAYEEKLSWVIARLDEIVDSFSPAIVGISLWTPQRNESWRQRNFWRIRCTGAMTTVKEPKRWVSMSSPPR